MKDLAEELMADMQKPGYVPIEAEALVVIGWQLKRIADALTADKGTASF